jgi:hypothetical protein
MPALNVWGTSRAMVPAPRGTGVEPVTCLMRILHGPN